MKTRHTSTRRRVISAMLTALFLAQQSMFSSVVMSTEITGVTGNGNVYDIDPTGWITGTGIGYRKYLDFNLSEGDIANLIFKYGEHNIETFINLVQNKITINGILNAMRDGKFYNGKAIFVSPNGMIVGASGVINVGSLGVYTPSNEQFNDYVRNPRADLSALTDSNSGESVTINGKVFAANDIDIKGGMVTVGKNAGMFAGINENKMGIMTSQQAADILFNQLVNTDNLNTGNAFSSNNGNIRITSEQVGKDAGINIAGVVKNFGNGDTVLTNSGKNGIDISGTVSNKKGTTELYNTWGDVKISGTVRNNGETRIINKPNSQTVTITVDGQEYTYTTDKESGIYIDGDVYTKGNVTITNEGEKGIKINGSVSALKNGSNNTGNVTISNVNNVDGGIVLDSTGRINAENDIKLTNVGKIGTRVRGLMNAGNNVDINNKYSHVIIGDDTDNNEYITAGNDVNIKVEEGSILNWAGFEGNTGVLGINDAKTLIKAGGNLNMDVTNGTIGQEVGAGCYGDYCTGISDATGTRDYAKSINANVGGTVTATTTDTYPGGVRDLVINYAAINSDMKIDHIKADGRVILTTDYDQNDGKTRYDMINASTDPNKANVEGWGISLISSGNIGSKDNKLTFNQTKAGQLANTENPTSKDGYGMDVLANEDIYIKGLDDKYTVNNVCSMISREGNIDAEFSGNTYIDEITAEGDINVVTRGKTLEINHLGTVPNTPVDYFGPRTQGQKDGGYMEPDLRDETLPNHVTLAALDINKNIRPDGEMVDGHYAWADSTVTVHNAQLDNGTLDITADNIYANGIEAHFNKDGFSKAVNDLTNPVIGASEIPTGHAVRPTNVSVIGRDVHERNYYYPEGDGDGIFNGKPSNVDPDDNIAEATPLAIADKIGPGPGPEPDPNAPDGQSGDITFIQRKIVDNAVDAIDKRQYMRFKVSDNTNPVLLERQNNGVNSLLDVSRGGIAVSHNNALKVGDVIPVHLAYGDLDINADVKIVSATSSRAGAEFVNIDKALANQLLYLSILLESKNNMLAANF